MSYRLPLGKNLIFSTYLLLLIGLISPSVLPGATQNLDGIVSREPFINWQDLVTYRVTSTHINYQTRDYPSRFRSTGAPNNVQIIEPASVTMVQGRLVSLQTFENAVENGFHGHFYESVFQDMHITPNFIFGVLNDHDPESKEITVQVPRTAKFDHFENNPDEFVTVAYSDEDDFFIEGGVSSKSEVFGNFGKWIQVHPPREQFIWLETEASDFDPTRLPDPEQGKRSHANSATGMAYFLEYTPDGENIRINRHLQGEWVEENLSLSSLDRGAVLDGKLTPNSVAFKPGREFVASGRRSGSAVKEAIIRTRDDEIRGVVSAVSGDTLTIDAIDWDENTYSTTVVIKPNGRIKLDGNDLSASDIEVGMRVRVFPEREQQRFVVLNERIPGESSAFQPIAYFHPDKPFAVSSHEFTFDGSHSYDLDGDVVSYEWNFGDGNTATGEVVNHTFAPSDGYEPYKVTLTVTSDTGETASDFQYITVIDGMREAAKLRIENLQPGLVRSEWLSGCDHSSYPDCGEPELLEEVNNTVKHTNGGLNEFKGYLKVPEDGWYEFRLPNRSMKLWIADTLILDHVDNLKDRWGPWDLNYKKSDIYLQAGFHPITLTTRQDQGHNNIIGWAGPGLSPRETTVGEINGSDEDSFTRSQLILDEDLYYLPSETDLVSAIASVSQKQGVAPLTISMSGLSSIGDIDTYEWRITDAVTGESVDLHQGMDHSFTFPETGLYDLTLEAGNTARGLTSTDTVQIAVEDSNQSADLDQTIQFFGIRDRESTDGSFALYANASSDLFIDFSVISGPASVSSNMVTLSGEAGIVTVKAEQVGNDRYNSAESVQSFIVTDSSKIDQSLTVSSIPDKTFDAEDFVVAATSSSGLPVEIEIISGPAVMVDANTVSLDGVIGEVIVQLSQAGGGTYNPAPIQYERFTVTKSLVSLTTLEANGRLAEGTSGVVQLRRVNDDLSRPLTVNISAAGTAISGEDYSALPDTVTFPVGEEFVTLDVTPLASTQVVGDASVTVEVTPDAHYNVADPDQVTLTLELLEAPTILSAGPSRETFYVGEPFEYMLGIIGSPAPSVTVSGLPGWLSFDGEKTLSGTPGPSDSGSTVDLLVTATNGSGTDTLNIAFDVVFETADMVILNPASNAFHYADNLLTLEGEMNLTYGVLYQEETEWSSDIDGALGSGLTLDVSDLSTGFHRISLTGTNGQSVQSSTDVILEVRPPLGEPRILAEPESASGFVTLDASFSAVAEGLGTLSYQWLKDGEPLANNDRISGAQTPNLEVANLVDTDDGFYSLEVTNDLGSTISDPARLNVLDIPSTYVYLDFGTNIVDDPAPNWNTVGDEPISTDFINWLSGEVTSDVAIENIAVVGDGLKLSGAENTWGVREVVPEWGDPLALSDRMWVNANEQARLRIHNLTPGAKYDIEIASSFAASSNAGSEAGVFRVEGSSGLVEGFNAFTGESRGTEVRWVSRGPNDAGNEESEEGWLYWPQVEADAAGEIQIHLEAFGGLSRVSVNAMRLLELTGSDSIQPSQLAIWRELYFGSLENEGDAADNANPAGDGLVNLLKYAVGLNPLVVATSEERKIIYLQSDGDQRYVDLRIPAALERPDIRYFVEYSEDLQSWNAIAEAEVGANFQPLPGTVATGAQRVGDIVRIPLSSEITENGFFRLHVQWVE